MKFVSIDPKRDEIAFISDAFRKFAEKKLAGQKKTIDDLIINKLLLDPDGEVALNSLPKQLSQAARFDDLLKYLTPDTFLKIVDLTSSYLTVQQKCDIGIRAAIELKNNKDLTRFSIYKAAISQLNVMHGWESEIKARMKLQQHEVALSLAQSAKLYEDRLHMLAIMAKVKREEGLTLEQELIDQIRELYTSIDPAALGERSIKIASDLIFSVPDLAIDMVEKAAKTDLSEDGLDRAFALVSLSASLDISKHSESIRALDKLKSMVLSTDPLLFFAEFSVLLGTHSAESVISEVEKLKNPADRLTLLRQWALVNQERPDTFIVVDYALKLAIRTTSYSPNATVFRQLASPLPYMSDADNTKELISKLDSQKRSIERLGPTLDYIRLQLLIAKAELKYDFDSALDRMIEIYLSISGITEDLVTKTECMSRFFADLNEMDPEQRFEVRDHLHTIAEEETTQNLLGLLDVVADQYSVLRGIITSLSRANAKEALDLISKLNTQIRRDEARATIIDTQIKAPSHRIDLRVLLEILGTFEHENLRVTSLIKILNRLAETPDQFTDDQIRDSLSIINQIDKIESATLRCTAHSHAYTFLYPHKEYETLLEKIKANLKKSWQCIDDGWQKVDAGFMIVGQLADSSMSEAQDFFGLVQKHRESIVLDNRDTIATYMACILLTIRAFRGFVPRRIYNSQDIGGVVELIEVLPSDQDRAYLYTQLILPFFLHGGSAEDGRRMIEHHLRPIIDSVSEGDMDLRNRMLVTCAPVLYCAHITTGMEQVLKLSQPFKDFAIYEIFDFITRKISSAEPYEGSADPREALTFDEIIDVINLSSQVDRDYLVYMFISHISKIVADAYKNHYSRQQKADICQRLQLIVDSKLPDRKNIKHIGYKIVAEAEIARMLQSRSEVWDTLVERAVDIPNLSDKAFVLALIASCMPAKEIQKQKDLLADAKSIIIGLPVLVEKISRLETLSTIASEIDQPMSRECLKLALDYSFKADGARMNTVRKRIIDSAMKLDHAFASSLASATDDDPARAEKRKQLRERLKVHDLKKKLADETSHLEFQASKRRDYAKAAWLCLGALNGGRIVPVKFDRYRELIRIAADYPLDDAYPILAYAIENAVRQNCDTDHAASALRPIYEASVVAAQLTKAFALKGSNKIKATGTIKLKDPSPDELIVRSGERTKALDFLRNWFERNLKDYLKICDPYFGPRDLEIVKIIQSVKPDCVISILTSRKHQEQEKVPTPWESSYRHHWRHSLSDQDPPITDVVVVGTKGSGELPIHDRWCLTAGAGLAVGASFNGLGRGKDSKLTILSAKEAEACESEIDLYFQHIKRISNGERIDYSHFSL